MKRVIGLVLVLAATALATAQQPLQIYVIDPEGGKAALWIAPSGETVLIDTGNPGERDLVRLKEAIISSLALSVFTLGAFVYGLKLQLPTWPWFIQ